MPSAENTSKETAKKGASEVYSFRFEVELRNLATRAAELDGVKLSEFVRDAIVKSASEKIQASGNESEIERLCVQVAKQLQQPTVTRTCLVQLGPEGWEEVEVPYDEYVFDDPMGGAISANALSSDDIASLRQALQHAPRHVASVLNMVMKKEESTGFKVVPIDAE